MAGTTAAPLVASDPPGAAPRGEEHHSTDHHSTGSVRLHLIGGALVLGLLLSGGLVWQRHVSAMPGPVRSWQRGAVSVAPQAAGSARLDISGLAPGTDDTHCQTVRYTGAEGARIRLYGTNYAEPAAGQVRLTITAGSGPSCTAFGTATTVYSGTVADFAATRTAFRTGVAGYYADPEASGRPFGFSYGVPTGTPEPSPGSAARVDFVWEARSGDAR